MSKLSDNELIDELRERFEQNGKALHDLRVLSETLGIMNKKLKESEALKSNFLANIRNEINNPLTAILGLAKVLVDRLEGGSEPSFLAGLIYAEAFDFYLQMRNILTAASLEAGDSIPFYARIDLCTLAQTTVDSFSHEIAKKGVEVVLDCDETSAIMLQEVFFDAEKAQIILANLLANAIEYSHEGGIIEVGLSCTEGRFALNVQDNGMGILPEKRNAIFDRFRQLDMGVSKVHRGHGLGLSIARELVDILGGSIVVSGAEGEGTLFSITLPIPSEATDVNISANSGNAFIFETDVGEDEPFTVTV
jgi:signal transduction histidine kinase